MTGESMSSLQGRISKDLVFEEISSRCESVHAGSTALQLILSRMGSNPQKLTVTDVKLALSYYEELAECLGIIKLAVNSGNYPDLAQYRKRIEDRLTGLQDRLAHFYMA